MIISMITLRINEILKEQGKTMYWLSRQTGISANNIAKICNGETSNIRFDTIERICLALNCPINDIFQSTDPSMQNLITFYSSRIENLNIQTK